MDIYVYLLFDTTCMIGCFWPSPIPLFMNIFCMKIPFDLIYRLYHQLCFTANLKFEILADKLIKTIHVVIIILV